MDYKRIEIYVGWTCNHKCIYCIEYPNMINKWKDKVSILGILKLLIKYRKLGYNHVTFLGGEPFIQEVFLDALKIAKKLGYNTLVTTNSTTLHIEKEAAKYLPYIDELILSVEAIDIDLQEKISQTKALVNWDMVFINIKKYSNLSLFKANIVINQFNKNKLYEIVEFLVKSGIKEIVLTYPDIDFLFYKKDYILEKIAPGYNEIFAIIDKILIDFLSIVSIKIADIPLCIIRDEKYIKLTDDFNYENRIKVSTKGKNNLNYSDSNKVLDREKISPRKRIKIKKCKKCIYKNNCWGVSNYYDILYGLSEIQPIL